MWSREIWLNFYGLSLLMSCRNFPGKKLNITYDWEFPRRCSCLMLPGYNARVHTTIQVTLLPPSNQMRERFYNVEGKVHETYELFSVPWMSWHKHASWTEHESWSFTVLHHNCELFTLLLVSVFLTLLRDLSTLIIQRRGGSAVTTTEIWTTVTVSEGTPF